MRAATIPPPSPAGTGEPTSTTHTATTAAWYAYDNEAALSFYGFRYYSPQLGRWLNRDPIGEDGGVPLFAYVRNSPINFTDALGLSLNSPPSSLSCDCCCCAEDITINNISIINAARFGHSFDVNIKTSWKIAPNQRYGDCSLAWYEHIALPMSGIQPNTWRDFIANPGPTTSMFDPWTISRTKPCFGSETTTVNDRPTGRLGGGFWGDQDLYFAITVTSAPGCGCAKGSVTVYARQQWSIQAGLPISESFSVLQALPSPPGNP